MIRQRTSRRFANPRIPDDPSVPIHLARDLALATAIAELMAAARHARFRQY